MVFLIRKIDKILSMLESNIMGITGWLTIDIIE